METKERIKTKELVTFEQAKRLKELGFDWETYHFYRNGELAEAELFNYNLLDEKSGIAFYSAPPLLHARRWLMDNINLAIIVEPLPVTPTMWHYAIRTAKNGAFRDSFSPQAYKDYNEALSAAIDAALNTLQTKKTDL